MGCVVFLLTHCSLSIQLIILLEVTNIKYFSHAATRKWDDAFSLYVLYLGGIRFQQIQYLLKTWIASKQNYIGIWGMSCSTIGVFFIKVIVLKVDCSIKLYSFKLYCESFIQPYMFDIFLSHCLVKCSKALAGQWLFLLSVHQAGDPLWCLCVAVFRASLTGWSCRGHPGTDPGTNGIPEEARLQYFACNIKIIFFFQKSLLPARSVPPYLDGPCTTIPSAKRGRRPRRDTIVGRQPGEQIAKNSHCPANAFEHLTRQWDRNYQKIWLEVTHNTYWINMNIIWSNNHLWAQELW